jgi:outer membrane scaffolding protein for murein synthesis (MipA/OmpV family)
MKSSFLKHAAPVALGVMLLAKPAQSQSFDNLTEGLTDALQTAIDLLPPDVTNVRLGLGPVISPDYEGSDDYDIDPVPAVSLRYGNFLEVDNNEVKLTAFNRLLRADANMGGGSSLRAGPLIRIDFGRDQSDSPDLAGMGDVNVALELGAFVSYQLPGGTRLRLRARHDVIDGHGGMLAIADVIQPFIRTAQFVLGGIVQATWASGPYMRSYFGVTPGQALASGYPVFTPGSGFKDINAGLNANYRIADRWSLVANINYKRLIGSAADSPIVRLAGSPNQMNYSAFVVYAF